MCLSKSSNLLKVGKFGYSRMRRNAQICFPPFGNVSAQDEKTPLHLSAAANHTQTVELLLEKGANIHATDVVGHICTVQHEGYAISQMKRR